MPEHGLRENLATDPLALTRQRHGWGSGWPPITGSEAIPAFNVLPPIASLRMREGRTAEGGYWQLASCGGIGGEKSAAFWPETSGKAAFSKPQVLRWGALRTIHPVFRSNLDGSTSAKEPERHLARGRFPQDGRESQGWQRCPGGGGTRISRLGHHKGSLCES